MQELDFWDVDHKGKVTLVLSDGKKISTPIGNMVAALEIMKDEEVPGADEFEELVNETLTRFHSERCLYRQKVNGQASIV